MGKYVELEASVTILAGVAIGNDKQPEENQEKGAPESLINSEAEIEKAEKN